MEHLATLFESSTVATRLAQAFSLMGEADDIVSSYFRPRPDAVNDTGDRSKPDEPDGVFVAMRPILPDMAPAAAELRMHEICRDALGGTVLPESGPYVTAMDCLWILMGIALKAPLKPDYATMARVLLRKAAPEKHDRIYADAEEPRFSYPGREEEIWTELHGAVTRAAD